MATLTSDKIIGSILAPLSPPVQTIRHYSWSKFRADMTAGITLCAVEVPQAMAYALIAGVPPQYGLYTSIIMGFVGALFTSNENLATGPTNTHCLLTASIATSLTAPGDGTMYLQTIFALTLIKGLIQLACAVGGMGAIVRYVSQSVIIGFTAGAGVLIAVGQLPSLLGLDTQEYTSKLPGVMGDLHALSRVIHRVDLQAVGLAVLTTVVVLAMRWWKRTSPGPLLAVVLCAAIVAGMNWTSQDVPLVPAVPRSLPSFNRLTLNHLPHPDGLLSGALALAAIGMIETVAIGKAMAVKTGHRIEPGQEFFSQGVSNIVGSFLSCIPGTGSFTRSALNLYAGGKTRFASVFNSVFILACLLVAAPAAAYIPKSALAAILVIVAFGLIDFSTMRRIGRTDLGEGVVLWLTFTGTLLLPLKYAIFVGIFISLAILIRRITRLHVAEMVTSPGGIFIEKPLTTRAGGKSVMFLQVEGDLFFGVADDLQDRLCGLAGGEVRVVVLRLKRTHSIDATALAVLEDFVKLMRGRGGHVVLCGVRPEIASTMQNFGLLDVLGKENFFAAELGVFSSAKAALARAKQLVGSSIDVGGLDFGEDAEGWAYEI